MSVIPGLRSRTRDRWTRVAPYSALIPDRLRRPGSRLISHIHVVRPAAALGRNPVDVLVRVLDVAGFAVDAVLGVDLVAHAALALDPFVHTRRAVELRGAAIDIVLGGLLQGRILHLEMDR